MKTLEQEQQILKIAMLLGYSYDNAENLWTTMENFAYGVSINSPLANSLFWEVEYDRAIEMMIYGVWDYDMWKSFVIHPRGYSVWLELALYEKYNMDYPFLGTGA